MGKAASVAMGFAYFQGQIHGIGRRVGQERLPRVGERAAAGMWRVLGRVVGGNHDEVGLAGNKD